MNEPSFMPEMSKISLSMAYVPFQQWEGLYDPTVGFERGTIFKSLDLPFIGEEAVPRGK